MLEVTLKKLKEIGLSSPEEKVPFITDEPKIPNFLTLPNEVAQKMYSTDGNHGQGYHFNEDLSRIKSIAEYLERLCLDNPDRKKLTTGLFGENSNMVDPALFCCYSDAQVGDKRDFMEKARLNEYLWFGVRDLVNGGEKIVPAQMVFLSDLFKEEFGIRREGISTGAALGEIGTNRAFDSGLLEAIERDSCIYAYLSRKDLPRIKGLRGEVKRLEEYLNRYNLEVFVFNATSDLEIPTAISVLVDRTGLGPAVDVGSSSDFNYGDAIYKSILESIQCRRHARIFNDGSFFEGVTKEDEIFSLEDRFIYWQPTERIEDLKFWLETEREVSYSSLESKINNSKEALEKLKEKGFNIFEADITLPEVRMGGFEVKKIIIPELHPLYLDERAKALYSIHYGEIDEDRTLKPHPLT